MVGGINFTTMGGRGKMRMVLVGTQDYIEKPFENNFLFPEKDKGNLMFV